MKATEAKEITVKAKEHLRLEALKELPRIYERIKTAAEKGDTLIVYYAVCHEAVVQALRAEGYLVTVKTTVEGPFTPQAAKSLTTTISWGPIPDWETPSPKYK